MEKETRWEGDIEDNCKRFKYQLRFKCEKKVFSMKCTNQKVTFLRIIKSILHYY